jgi:hypothetical protein
MSTSDITKNIEKEKRQIDKILSFATGKYVDIPTISHNNNSKTQKQIAQVGIVKETTKTSNHVHTRHRLTSTNEDLENLERILTEALPKSL